ARPHHAGQALEHLEGDLHPVPEQLEERLAGEAGDQAFLRGDDAGRARLGVDSRQLAEIVAGREGGEGDLAPRERVVEGAGAAMHQEEHLAALGAALEDAFARAENAPAAVGLDALTFGLVEAGEQLDSGKSSRRWRLWHVIPRSVPQCSWQTA